MKDKHVSRRDFVKVFGVAGAGSLVGAGQAFAQSNVPSAATTTTPVKPAKVPTRTFVRTGVPVSMLALGGIFDIESNQLVLQQALDWGVTYWDTAAGYNGGRSEGGIGMYLEKHPQVRKNIFLVTKYDGGGLTQALNQSLEKLKTDYIDMYFLHGLDNAKALDEETKAWVEKAKADKKIRFFGFSTHSNMENCLQAAAKLGWIDGIMLKYDFRIMSTDTMKAAMDAATKAAQAEARSKAKTQVNRAPTKAEAAPAAPVAQPTKPAEPAPAKPTSLFDVPASTEDGDDSTTYEGNTAEPEESEELDEAA